MYNKVLFVGHLTKDAELRYLPNGTAIAEFTLAVNTKYGETEETLFISNALFGKVAESLQKYLTKGSLILVDGRLQEQKWQSDGGERRKFVVIVRDVRLLKTKEKEGENKAPIDDKLEPF